MSVIQIEICVGNLHQKCIVMVIPELHHTVNDFLEYVSFICEIPKSVGRLKLFQNQFILPGLLSTNAIKKETLYIIRSARDRDSYEYHCTANTSNRFLRQNSSQRSSVSSSESSKQVTFKLKKKSQQPKNSKKNIKKQKKYRKQDQIIVQQSVNKKKSFRKGTIKKNRIKQISSQESSEESQKLGKAKKVKPIIQKVIKKIPRQSSQESNQQSKSSQLPCILNHEKSNKIIGHNNMKKNIIKKVVNIKKPLKTKIILDSSQESSEVEIIKQKKQEINTKKILPSAIRINMIKGSLNLHKQHQWIPIGKTILDSTQDWSTSGIIVANNKIKFKIMELDEEKFIPILSDWIQGDVQSISSDGHIHMRSVNIGNKKYHPIYEIYLYNLTQLHLSKTQASTQQIDKIIHCSHKQSFNKQCNQLIQTHHNIKQTVYEGENSIQSFICGQIHHYFSDKNYNTDLFMQMHANKNPQKYIPISLLLNFPKIKKVLRSKQKLLQYLLNDVQKQGRNYQLDQLNLLIRKKNTSIEINQKQKSNQPEE